MPFTFSHPAIVLPLSSVPKRWISMAGLIIGSMVPDFEYFIRLKVESIYSHTWLGLFWFDLPIGLVTLIIYQQLIKDRLIDNLPQILYERLCVFKGNLNEGYSFQNISIMVVSILIGATSHILWDGFTHPDGLFVKSFTTLNTIINIAGHHVHVYKIIQHASSLLGAFAILITVYLLPISNCNNKQSFRGYWVLVFSVATIMLIIKLLAGLRITQYGNLIVTIIAGCFLGLIIASLSLSRQQNIRY